jgi:hypothetical protein
MKQPRILISVIVLFTSFLYVTSFAACSKKISTLPYIPPDYYAAIAVNPHQLFEAYYPSYTDDPIFMGAVEYKFNGKIFAFKGVKVTQFMLQNAVDGYVWVDLIKCYPLEGNALSDIKAGETMDVVGVNAGLCPDFLGALKFSNCIFLPGGCAQIPAPGSEAFLPLY